MSTSTYIAAMTLVKIKDKHANRIMSVDQLGFQMRKEHSGRALASAIRIRKASRVLLNANDRPLFIEVTIVHRVSSEFKFHVSSKTVDISGFTIQFFFSLPFNIAYDSVSSVSATFNLLQETI